MPGLQLIPTLFVLFFDMLEKLMVMYSPIATLEDVAWIWGCNNNRDEDYTIILLYFVYILCIFF